MKWIRERGEMVTVAKRKISGITLGFWETAHLPLPEAIILP